MLRFFERLHFKCFLGNGIECGFFFTDTADWDDRLLVRIAGFTVLGVYAQIWNRRVVEWNVTILGFYIGGY